MKKLVLTFLASLVIFSVQTIQAQSWSKGSISGEGEITKRVLEAGSFTGVSSGVHANVIIKQGNANRVEVQAQSNIIDNLDLVIKNGTLHIKNKKNVRNTKAMTIYITTPELHVAGVSGSGSFKTDGHFSNVGNIQISVSGSGNMDLDIDARDITTSISGSGNVHLTGKGVKNDIRVSGSGDIDARNLKVIECYASISGSGDCKVNVSSILEGHISGSGSIKYEGQPKVKAKVSGSGSIDAI